MEHEALSADEREDYLALGADLERAWTHERASPERRKRIVRAVLGEIVATVQGNQMATGRGVGPMLSVKRVLRPLGWFNLIECRDGPAVFVPGSRCKCVLFDRFLWFATGVVRTEGESHRSMALGVRSPLPRGVDRVRNLVSVCQKTYI